jgi:biotin transport system ATP-binding protein
VSFDIHLNAVSVRLGEHLALEDVSVRLNQKRIAVIGANGSGKSTFARLLGGLVTAESGSVSVLGLEPGRQAKELRRRVSFIFSNPDAQIIMPTVAEDAAFSLRSERLPKAIVAERVAVALREFGLSELADRAAHDLSGGQKQLLALCGALIREPALVIADEPTAYLDARNSRLIASHLLGDRDRGTNPGADAAAEAITGHRLVLVTHDLALAARCDVAVLFDGGRLTAVGDPDDVIERYETSLQC